MPRRFQDIRVRLFQIREEEHVLQEERESFLDAAGLAPEQLLPTNVLRDPLTVSLLEGIDAVFIGGAGAYSVADDHPWMPALIELLQHIYRHNIPLFGSCWGHQLIARAYGGRVIHDPEHTEVGCFDVTLTPEGKCDPLFCHLPERFPTLMGHQDRVAELPPQAIELAYSDTLPYQVIRMQGKPIYGTQFHSELNAACERERILTYRQHYPVLHDEKRFREIYNAIEDTPHVRDLLRRFLNIYVLHEQPADCL